MTEKLDNYSPTMETVLGVRQQLLRAGIDIDHIPHDWMPAIIAAMTKWLTTEEGLKYVCGLFNLKATTAKSDREYTLIDHINKVTKSVKNTQVCLLEGVVVDGKPVAVIDEATNHPIQPLELEISEIAKNTCDGCGILAHCLTEIREHRTDRLMSYCNYCLAHHEDLRVRDHGCLEVCAGCTVCSCSHYKNTRAQ